ncbi:TIGR02679 family protein [Blastococcus sp. BMG 814]|uniref:TIGR02679 family protein n=1 Tax=Blastococcus carthaginiensis TaxID=3050034 RepID=A0ABT9IGZ2_9ACTN|nr:TIGR02679 family protein [Blastococcus carthaginiensis]MDP5184831.1 TIGR02679 family protein [Blastococcus carthaginiensis]
MRVDLAGLTEAQVAAMANFLRWPTHRSGVVTVDLGRTDRLLRASGLQAGLAAALIAAGGPLRDTAGARRAARDAKAAAGVAVWAAAAEHPALARHPELAGWLADERAAGRMPGDPVVRGQVLTDALTVLAALPDPGTGLARLAQRTLGRAHALDGGPVVGAVLRALVRLTGRPVPEGAAARRELWAAVGVAVDTVSSTALVCGLRVTGGGPLPVTLAVNADAGLAVRLTLAQVQAHLDGGGGLTCPGEVFVCENPSVVEDAVARLGAACPPVVCVEGWPSVATMRLLTALIGDGARLRYHGDFDWQGLQIAAEVFGLGATSWRFGAGDYAAALSAAHPQLRPLGAVPAALTAGWDTDLVGAMTSAGLAVEEEHVLDLLVADLNGEVARRAGPPARRS